MTYYPATLPSNYKFSSFTLKPVTVSGMTRSVFTGLQRVQSFAGQWWEGKASLNLLTKSEAAVWRAFFTSLNGLEGYFLMGDPNGAVPLGLAASNPGTPVVDGEGQTGNSLTIRNAPTSITGWLKAGDFFQLGDQGSARLYQCLADVDIDENGNSTISMFPRLRLSPADGSLIYTSNCKGLFRLMGETPPIEISPPHTYSLNFNFVELME
jgi:hypothetical protein